jgi:hypothetical protein
MSALSRACVFSPLAISFPSCVFVSELDCTQEHRGGGDIYQQIQNLILHSF